MNLTSHQTRSRLFNCAVLSTVIFLYAALPATSEEIDAKILKTATPSLQQRDFASNSDLNNESLLQSKEALLFTRDSQDRRSESSQTQTLAISGNSTTVADSTNVSEFVGLALNLAGLSGGSTDSDGPTSASSNVSALALGQALCGLICGTSRYDRATSRGGILDTSSYTGTNLRNLGMTLGFDGKEGDEQRALIYGVRFKLDGLFESDSAENFSSEKLNSIANTVDQLRELQSMQMESSIEIAVLNLAIQRTQNQTLTPESTSREHPMLESLTDARRQIRIDLDDVHAKISNAESELQANASFLHVINGTSALMARSSDSIDREVPAAAVDTEALDAEISSAADALIKSIEDGSAPTTEKLLEALENGVTAAQETVRQSATGRVPASHSARHSRLSRDQTHDVRARLRGASREGSQILNPGEDSSAQQWADRRSMTQIALSTSQLEKERLGWLNYHISGALDFSARDQESNGTDEYVAKVNIDIQPMERSTFKLNSGFLYQEIPDSKDGKGGELAYELSFNFTDDLKVDGRKPINMSLGGIHKWLSDASDEHKGQLKLTIPLLNGVSLPISASIANRTALIDETDVRGQIGFSIDTSNLAQLFSPATRAQ